MRGQYKNTKLRSTLEDKVNLKLQEILGKKTDEFYEAETIEYTVPEKIKRYTPDFKIAEGVFIETKGIWDKADRDKILLVKQQRPDIKILMLFWNAGYKIYPRSKTTYATFCDTNGIEWADIKYGIPDKWLEYITKDEPKKKSSRSMATANKPTQRRKK